MTTKEFVAGRDLHLIGQLAETLDRALSDDAAVLLGRYLQLVAVWNRKIGLTSAREAAAQVEVLLADALMVSNWAVVPSDSRIVDVGSGAGAPAVPLLLLREDLSAVLVESNRKRVAFLRAVTGEFALDDRLRVVEQRLRPEAPSVPGQPFDVAISRATFPPHVWVGIGVALASLTLVFTARDQPPAPPAGTVQKTSIAYRLPGTGAPRRVTVYATVEKS